MDRNRAQTVIFNTQGGVLMNVKETMPPPFDALFVENTPDAVVESEITITRISVPLGGEWLKVRSSVRLQCSQTRDTIEMADEVACNLAIQFVQDGYARAESRMLSARNPPKELPAPPPRAAPVATPPPARTPARPMRGPAVQNVPPRRG